MNRRDVELLISARDTTGRAFGDVVNNIEALNRKINEQVEAAERGEGSLRDLRRVQDELAQAGRDLSALQGQIDAYRRLEEQQRKTGTAAEQAVQDWLAYKAQIEAAGAATDAQTRRLDGLEKKVATTSAALERTTADLSQQGEVLQRAGIDLLQLDTAQKQIVVSARQAGQGFSALSASVDSFSDNIRLAREAEQNLAAQQTFDRKAAEAAKLVQAGEYIQFWTNALTQMENAEQQLQQLTAFRAVGAQAAEASRDVTRFVEAGRAVPLATAEIAQGLRAIIDPAGEALRTLAGVEQQIREASAVATAEKQTVAAYSAALNDLSAAAAAIVQQGALIDSFERQAAATALARQQFEQAQGDVQRLGSAMQQADVPVEQLAQDLKVAETRLTQTGRALNAEETKLGELSRALKKAGVDTNELTVAQQRLEVAAQQVATASDQANQVLGRGGRKPAGLFGLNPYELQNLGYQINDVVVGLASGQKPLTVLVQQGLQISQILPGLISGIARFVLAWFPLIAVLGVTAAAIGKYVQEANRLRQAQEDLARIPTGGLYDPQTFVEAQKGMEKLGASAEDARTALLALAEEGFSPEQLVEYSKTAGQLAERLGVDVAEAAELLLGIQKGGIETVLDLAEKTNDLTVAEIEHAEALFDAGNAAEARQFILDRVADRNQQIADATRSAWTPAVNNLKTAWSGFTSFLGDVFAPTLDGINKQIEDTIVGFTFLTGLLAGRGFEGALADARTSRQQYQGRGAQPGRGATDQQVRDKRFERELDAEIDKTRELTKEERLQKAAIEARTRAQEAGVSQALEERAVRQAIAEEERKIAKEQEKADKRSSAAAKRQNREAEAAQRKIDQARQQLENQLRQLDSATGRGSSATLEERLRVVDNQYAKIFDTLQKMRNLGLSTGADGQSLATIEAEVKASKERLKNEESIKFFEEQINLLIGQRKEETDTIADAQRRGSISAVDAFKQAEAVNARLSPQIIAAAQNALQIARSIAGTTPSPEMVSLIARLERLSAGEQSGTSFMDTGLELIEQQEARINKLTQERQARIEAANRLAERGLITEAEARERIAKAYADTATAAEPLVVTLDELIRKAYEAGLITETAFAAWQAKIETLNQDLQYTDERLLQVQAAASRAIQQGVTNAFNTAAESIVGLIAGTKSWGDVLEGVFTTALQFAQQFLQAIADVLVQMIALQVAKSLIGGGFGGFMFHSGGVVGSGGGSHIKRTGGSDSWFGAPKFHSGGGIGLRPDEYKAVLQRGEEVLTEDNPRHINNVGKGGEQQAQSLKQVLYLDPEQVVGAMRSRSGERSILTVIRTNKETIKQVLA